MRNIRKQLAEYETLIDAKKKVCGVLLSDRVKSCCHFASVTLTEEKAAIMIVERPSFTKIARPKRNVEIKNG